MKILVGSYKENIYEIKIDEKLDKIIEVKELIKTLKPSYLMNFNGLSYIYSDNLKKQYIKIGDASLLLDESACHLSYDFVNKLIYVSFYHDGLLKVLKKINNTYEIIETISYEKHSHIHFASYIETINLVGVCDLGDDKFLLYDSSKGKLELKASYKFHTHLGPRHFISHKTLPIIYVLNELTPSISTFEYKDNELVLIDTINLIEGAGSAIRISNDGNFLFAGVRFSNYIYSFEIQKNGLLRIMQKVHTMGDHPRDFDLILNDKYLLVPNMNTNNLTLYKHNNGILTLVDYNVYLNSGASVVTIK